MSDQSGIAESRDESMSLHDGLTPPRHRAQTKDLTVIAAVDASYTRLTSRNASLLLIDHQIGPLWELEFAEIRRSVVALAEFGRRMRLPTVITAIGVETWGPVIPELTEAFNEAPHIGRSCVNAWEEPRVRAALENVKRGKLLIAGGAGAPSVTLCALSAVAAGYEVYCVIDSSAQVGHDAITRLSRDGVIVTTTRLVQNEMLNEHVGKRRLWR